LFSLKRSGPSADQHIVWAPRRHGPASLSFQGELLMRRLTAAISILLFSFSSSLFAQTFRGGIQGTVTDTTGAVVTGADISVNSPATGLTRTARTDASGSYFISELPIGSYNVTVRARGFRPTEVKDVSVRVSPTQQVSVELVLGDVTQVVE